MDGGCHGGGGGGGNSGGGRLLFTVLDILIYCVRYINLLCNKYYFNI